MDLDELLAQAQAQLNTTLDEHPQDAKTAEPQPAPRITTVITGPVIIQQLVQHFG